MRYEMKRNVYLGELSELTAGQRLARNTRGGLAALIILGLQLLGKTG